MGHAAASYDEVVQAIRRADPELARSPFRHKVTYARSEHHAVLAGHEWRPLATESFSADDYLTMICVEEPDRLVIIADHDSTRDDSATVERLLDAIITVLIDTEDRSRL